MKTKMEVLLVGPKGFCDSIQERLTEKKIEVIRATTLEEARRLFVEGSDIDVIVVNEIMQRDMDTLEFVSEIRHSSGVLMYACCSCDGVGKQFVAAGCHNYIVGRPKVLEALDDIVLSLCH